MMIEGKGYQWNQHADVTKIPDVVWAALGASLLTLVGVFTQNLWEGRRLAHRWNETQARIQTRQEDQRAATERLGLAQRGLAVGGVEAGLKFGEALAKATPTVRRELANDSDFDEDGYLDIMKKASDKVSGEWSEFVVRLE